MHSMIGLCRCQENPDTICPVYRRMLCSSGNCRQAVFYADEDYKRYLDWLIEGASRHGCQIHAYVLMTNQVRR